MERNCISTDIGISSIGLSGAMSARLLKKYKKFAHPKSLWDSRTWLIELPGTGVALLVDTADKSRFSFP